MIKHTPFYLPHQFCSYGDFFTWLEYLIVFNTSTSKPLLVFLVFFFVFECFNFTRQFYKKHSTFENVTRQAWANVYKRVKSYSPRQSGIVSFLFLSTYILSSELSTPNVPLRHMNHFHSSDSKNKIRGTQKSSPARFMFLKGLWNVYQKGCFWYQSKGMFASSPAFNICL